MTIDFTNVFNTLKTGVINLAQKELEDYVAQATKDGQSILNAMKDNLQTWTQQLANGDIDKDDFAFNVLGQKDVLEMVALKQAGLAAIRLDQFKADLINLITTTITALIP